MKDNVYTKSTSILEINTKLKTSDLKSRVFDNLATLETYLLPKDVKIWEEVKQALFDDSTVWPIQQHVLMEASKQDEKFLARYLCARFRYDFFPRLKQLSEYPPCVQIEPSSICN